MVRFALTRRPLRETENHSLGAVPDILEKRAPHRASHLAAAQRCVDDGTLLMAGAFTAAPMGAAFVFTPKATPALVEQFVAADPYVAAKLVTKWRVAEWAVPVLSPAVTL